MVQKPFMLLQLKVLGKKEKKEWRKIKMIKRMIIEEMGKKFSIKELTEYLEIIPIDEESSELIEFIKDIIKYKKENKNG